jgi:hypothetical protein
MQAAAATTTQREKNEQARMRALVRFNGSTFRSLAAASFLETAVPLHVNRLTQVLGADPDVGLWLEQVWWPQRAELGRQLRAHIESTWPEFDWNGAYHEFYESYRPLSGLAGLRARTAREALALCVTEAQAALFYRALANSADEPQLRALAREAACDHAAFFDFFRAYFERRKRIERVGFIATLRTVTAICRSARDHDVAAAFQALDHNWRGAAIVPGIDYPEYRQRMGQLLLRHAALGPVERLLFRPWLDRGRAVPAPQLQANQPNPWLRMAAPPAAA